LRDSFTIGDVAIRCDVSMKTVRRAIKAGELRAMRFNRQVVRIARADLESWVERCTRRAVSINGTPGRQ